MLPPKWTVLISMRPYIRASYPIEIPFLDEMLKFCAAKLTMAKTLAISFDNGSLKDCCIRPDDEVHQRSILNTILARLVVVYVNIENSHFLLFNLMQVFRTYFLCCL
uniref:FERM domain-containing protein n=1 Tax=Heterorhabditis bacteriophora TaxID=37862 RepID=A0A1I7WGV4_HETBA